MIKIEWLEKWKKKEEEKSEVKILKGFLLLGDKTPSVISTRTGYFNEL